MFGSKSRRARLAAEVVDPAEVEGAVADGLLIAKSAATIAVANRIILRALREQKPFDRDETAAAVRDELDRLATEQVDLAGRLSEERAKALKARGRSRHQFDYRVDDNTALASRVTISTSIAGRLRGLAADHSYVDSVVTTARDRAWGDIGGAVIQHAKEVVVPDASYEEGRDDRLRDLLDVDLAALAARPDSKPADPAR